MLMKLGAGVLVASLGLGVGTGVAVHQYGTVVVRVEERGPAGHSFTIPVPLALARLAVSFVPVEELRAEAAELRLASRLAAVVTEELSQYPDTVLVQVESPDESVLVYTADGELCVDVDTSDERVTVRVPLWGATQILEVLAERAEPLPAESTQD